ncbi:MAG: rod shape-determining protein MreD [Actinobacteria bacterium]|uniref:Rod shape-determining protein MreD n=1 Tax=Candidatus Fonsibacter lacus TaxID=2576439 RepID=A0A965GCD9_9PROT|nr:rod shape-determining protein MreD [Candidatus Fonsibacter lacus]
MRKTLFFLPIAVITLALQNAVISRISFPFADPSIFLVVVLAWAFLEDPEFAALQGFLSGLLLDLNPLSVGLIGHWAFVLAAICYGTSELGVQLRSSRRAPLTLTVTVTGALLVTLIFFAITSWVISAEQGLTFARTAPGVLLWSAVFTPLLSPFIIRVALFAQGSQGARGIGALNG